jgi:hypothetical protein
MAMGIKYLWPNALSGVNADDDYLRTVLKYGDTTSASAQVRAAADYKVKATFKQDGTRTKLVEQLAAGRPIPCGFLHHGPNTAPRGGGHWILVIGITESHVIVHDPYGELDNVNGGYPRPGVGGRQAAYTWKNWSRRWEVEGPGTGWYVTLDKIDAPKAPQVVFSNTWDGVKAAAKAAGARFPQVVAAQWALESGFGKHTSGKNNFFGIKGVPGTTKETKEFLNGKWVTITDTFKDYQTPQECVSHLVTMWYRDYKGYRGVNNAPNWESCCHMLRDQGYATDPAYPQKLIQLIRENDK